MTYPKVTIGVTTYNAEDTIRDALQSAFSQTIPAHQIIVVDDCSTDSTMEVLADYASRANFELRQNPVNGGVAVSRNVIVDYATGDFIVFFDDDDISAKNRVEEQIQRIVQYEERFAAGAPVICHTACRKIYPDGREMIEPTVGQVPGRRAPHGRAVARRALMGEPLEDAYGSCATCSQAARTDTYLRLGGFDERFRRCEDSDIAIRLALAGGHFVGISEPLVTQRMTATSEKSLEELRRYNLKLLEKHRAVFHDLAHYEFCRNWIELKFEWLEGRHSQFAIGLARLAFRHPKLTERRVRMAMPTWSRNRTFGRFSRGVN